MGITFNTTPKLFGSFHLCALVICAVFNFLVYRFFKDKDEDLILKTMHCCGAFMMVMEVFKQIFCYYYVFGQKINLWFFPWQLCSMAMYCSFMITKVRRKMQNTLLVFLSSYSLLAAIIALAVPSDMLRPQVFLTVYSFLYHILMISLSLLSVIIIRRRDDVTFKYSIALFLIMALIAELINVISHLILHDIHLEPDMFYITPYYETTQPVFDLIAVRFGIFAEVIIYLSLIILCSCLIYETIRKKL